VSSSFTPRIIEDSTVHSMVCAPHTVRNQRSATSITSMILTVRPPTIGSRQAPGTFEAPRGSGKPLITGIASHLNHVPVTTCHIEDRRALAGMRVAYITPKQGDVPSGRKQASGILIKRGSERGKCPSDTTCVPDKNKNSPPHTSRRQITPRQAGFFLPSRVLPKKSPEDLRGSTGRKRDGCSAKAGVTPAFQGSASMALGKSPSM
jgi:hypothetical protein